MCDMKAFFVIAFLLFSTCGFSQQSVVSSPTREDESSVVSLTQDDFIDKVFDFKNQKDWKYNGTRPCIVDFFATWCGPCKMIAPIYAALANEYKGEVDFYRVNTDQARELSAYFGIHSIPALMYVPAGDAKPLIIPGARPIEVQRQLIDLLLLGKHPVQVILERGAQHVQGGEE